MAPRSTSVKRWIVAVAAAGGVATGVVTAAGATSTPPAQTSAVSSRAQQLDREVAALTDQERALQSSLSLLHPRSADPVATSSEVGQASAGSTQPAVRAVVVLPAPPTTAPPQPAATTTTSTASSEPEQTVPTTTTAPPTTATTGASGSNPSGSGDDGGDGSSSQGTTHGD